MGQFFLGVMGSPQGFLLRERSSGRVVAEAGAGERVLPRSRIALADGEHDCELVYVDAWGIESDAVYQRLSLAADASQASSGMIPASAIATSALAGGRVRLSWIASDLDGGLAEAASYEVADASDLATVLLTQAAGRRRDFSGIELDPGMSHGTTANLRLRASDGQVGGLRGLWVAAPPVVIDSEGHGAPTVYPSEVSR